MQNMTCTVIHKTEVENCKEENKITIIFWKIQTVLQLPMISGGYSSQGTIQVDIPWTRSLRDGISSTTLLGNWRKGLGADLFLSGERPIQRLGSWVPL